MAYLFQSFSVGQVLTAAQMNQVEVNIRDHVHGSAGVAAVFASGTRMLFQQTSAPTGWTKETSATYNDAALRMTTGTVGTGGADAFSTHFGTGKSTAGFTLATTDIPAHAHGVNDSGHPHEITAGSVTGTLVNGNYLANNSGGTDTSPVKAINENDGRDTMYNTFLTTMLNIRAASAVTSISIQNAGGGGSHAHVLNNFNIKFADCIIASKD